MSVKIMREKGSQRNGRAGPATRYIHFHVQALAQYKSEKVVISVLMRTF
jgi:hypothetical protein